PCAPASSLPAALPTSFSGSVVERPARRHQWVEAGMPIAELVDNTQLRAVGDVPAEAAAALKPGAPARLMLPDLGRELAVQVEAVDRKSTRLNSSHVTI